MNAESPSRLERATTWLALALAAVLLALGIVWYGLSLEVQNRFWTNLLDRLHGPMTFRFYLQPAMAAIIALADGIRDARHGHKSFFWTVWRDPAQRGGRLREGFVAVSRVILLGISMDVIYQFKVFDRFYPVEALTIAILVAVIPYFVCRWIVERIATRWRARKAAHPVS
jgi:hypothetical protein